MNEKNKFAANSPLGYIVECSKDVWDNHITTGHPIMKNNEQTVIDAITNPVAIYKSGDNPKRHVYFGDTKNATYSKSKKIEYTKVVVRELPSEKTKYTTVTAFPSKNLDGNIDGGEVLYVDNKPRPRE